MFSNTAPKKYFWSRASLKSPINLVDAWLVYNFLYMKNYSRFSKFWKSSLAKGQNIWQKVCNLQSFHAHLFSKISLIDAVFVSSGSKHFMRSWVIICSMEVDYFSRCLPVFCRILIGPAAFLYLTPFHFMYWLCCGRWYVKSFPNSVWNAWMIFVFFSNSGFIINLIFWTLSNLVVLVNFFLIIKRM